MYWDPYIMQIENKKLEPAILVKKGMDFLIPVDSRQYYRFFQLSIVEQD